VSKPLRPFFSYYGSKWSLGRHYPAPSHGTIVEPFAGSAGYALFHSDRRVLLVDSDPVVAGLWQYLIRASAAEIRSLPAVIACENHGAEYLPFEPFRVARANSSRGKGRTSREVVWTNKDAA
jgi:site-specific DNA-adenine methylase